MLHSQDEMSEQSGVLLRVMSRVGGSNGFQLLNVTNVPIILRGIGFQNRLVNKVGTTKPGTLLRAQR